MGHLVGHVLPISQLALVDAKLAEEQLDPREKVAERLVVDDALLHGGPNGHGLDVGLASQLRFAV